MYCVSCEKMIISPGSHLVGSQTAPWSSGRPRGHKFWTWSLGSGGLVWDYCLHCLNQDESNGKITISMSHTRKHTSVHKNTPGEEDAFNHIEVLHEHISLGLGAEVANSISNTQLDGPFQGWGGGLEAENKEKNNITQRGWLLVDEIVMPRNPTSNILDKRQRRTAYLLVCCLARGIYPPVTNLLFMSGAKWGRHLL